MKIGFDYWNVLSHYPKEFGALVQGLCVAFSEGADLELHVISAIGKGRIGTIEKELFNIFLEAGYESDVIFNGGVHEVVFDNYKQSPELKLAKCKELGITMFFDDRQDVCDLLNENGILAMHVPRKQKGSDLETERQ